MAFAHLDRFYGNSQIDDLLPVNSLVDQVSSQVDQKDQQVTRQAVDGSGASWIPLIFDRNVWMRDRWAQDSGPQSPEQDSQCSGPQSDFVAFSPALKNHFGNLPFSEAIWANNFPAETQQAQIENIFLPVWAMRTLNAPSRIADPFETVFAELRRDIEDGADTDALLGPHAFIGSLEDEETFNKAPKLSRVVASMVKSIKAGETFTTVTQYAMMWRHWILWKWMLQPSPETYRDLPALLRPTPYQLFVSHARMFDFIPSPSLRDYVCQTKNPDYRWLTEACISVACDWPRTKHEALSRDGITNELDLNTVCKVSGPSLSYVRPQLTRKSYTSPQPKAGLLDPRSGRSCPMRIVTSR